MPRGPKGEKRPRDVIGTAIMVAKIATGEIIETEDGKDPAAKSMGRRGGKARAASMTPERRQEIARKAAETRWRLKRQSWKSSLNIRAISVFHNR